MQRVRFFTAAVPALGLAALLATGCVSARPDITADTSALRQQQQTQSYQGLKRKVAIARFSNETEYAKGAFYDKNNDPLGKQALDILSTRLASSGKFILLERADADAIQKELEYSGRTDTAQKVGADYLIIGSVTEFGRKNTGETGVFSQTKRQTVQAGVSIRLVDVSTGEVIYAEEGKGEAETEATTVLGYGAQAGYDATLSDKAISAAISQLVDNVINNCMDRPWKSYILSADDGMLIMAGGAKQGVKPGDVYGVYERGRQVKNPQTGMMIEIPGKKVGEVSVISTGGSSVSDEFAIISVASGSLDLAHPEKYEVRERK
ncbi:MAG TPA: penicillin-binding protein activator LpoB [Treponema sp.]|nr:penicillin-binding protein activator LpoB [Treponema sp.]